ncbi:unnamed protein product, partial [Ixodes hexagonus]
FLVFKKKSATHFADSLVPNPSDSVSEASNSTIHGVSQSEVATVGYSHSVGPPDVDDSDEVSHDANVTSGGTEQLNEPPRSPSEHSGGAEKLSDPDDARERANIEIGVIPTEAIAHSHSWNSMLSIVTKLPNDTHGSTTSSAPPIETEHWEQIDLASTKLLGSSTRTGPLMIEPSRQLELRNITSYFVKAPGLTESSPRSLLTQSSKTINTASSWKDGSVIQYISPVPEISLAPRKFPSSPLKQHQVKTSIIADLQLTTKGIAGSIDTKGQTHLSFSADTISPTKVPSRSDFTLLATQQTATPYEKTVSNLDLALNPSQELNWIASSTKLRILFHTPGQDADSSVDATDAEVIATSTTSFRNPLNRGCANTCSWKRRSKSSAVHHGTGISEITTRATGIAASHPSPASHEPQEQVPETFYTSSPTQFSNPTHSVTSSAADALENGNFTGGNASHMVMPSSTLTRLGPSQSSMPSDHGSWHRAPSPGVNETEYPHRTNWPSSLTQLESEHEGAVLPSMSTKANDLLQKDIVQKMMTVTVLRPSFSQVTPTLNGEVSLAKPASESLLTRAATPALSSLTEFIVSSSSSGMVITETVQAGNVSSLLPGLTEHEDPLLGMSNVLRRVMNQSQSEVASPVASGTIHRSTEQNGFANFTVRNVTLNTKPSRFLQISGEWSNVVKVRSSSVDIQPSKLLQSSGDGKLSSIVKVRSSSVEIQQSKSLHNSGELANIVDVRTSSVDIQPSKSLQGSGKLSHIVEVKCSSANIQPSVLPSPEKRVKGDSDVIINTSEGPQEKTSSLYEVQASSINATSNSAANWDVLNVNSEASLYATPTFPSLHTSSFLETSVLRTSSPDNGLALERSIASSSVLSTTSRSLSTLPELGRDSINNAVFIDGHASSSTAPTLNSKQHSSNSRSQTQLLADSWANQGSGFPYAFNNISVASRVVEYPLVRIRTRVGSPQQIGVRRAKWNGGNKMPFAGSSAPGSSNHRAKRPPDGNSTPAVVLPPSAPNQSADQLVPKHRDNGSVGPGSDTVLTSLNVSLFSEVSENELSAKTSSFDDPAEESTGPEFSRSMALWPFLAPLLLLMLLPPAVWWLLKPEALPPPPFPPPPFPRPPPSSQRPSSLRSW